MLAGSTTYNTTAADHVVAGVVRREQGPPGLPPEQDQEDAASLDEIQRSAPGAQLRVGGEDEDGGRKEDDNAEDPAWRGSSGPLVSSFPSLV